MIALILLMLLNHSGSPGSSAPHVGMPSPLNHATSALVIAPRPQAPPRFAR
jgi:hypothetical protein